jgi:hypothetical protein
MRVWLWFTVCTCGQLVPWGYGVAECSVGQRPWCLLTCGVLKAGLDALDEGVYGGEGGVDVGGGVGNEV